MKKKASKRIHSDTQVKITEKQICQCKNCSTKIDGNFCHFCGQRYHDHKESFGELVYEFTSDFLHFDSRFFKTILPLLFTPGRLTKQYNEGKQRSQFHPIRLYLFSSFVYFFLFFYFNNVEEKLETTENRAGFQIDSPISSIKKDSINQAFTESPDSSSRDSLNTSGSISNIASDKKTFVTLSDSSRNYSFTVTSYIDSLLQKNISPEEYLKLQASLGSNKKDSYIERIITLKLLKINLEGEKGKKEFFKKLIVNFLHNIPKMLFFLLPVFALLLKLLYIRRKQFYYVDHAILSLHYFSFIFLMLILCTYILDPVFNTMIFTSLAIFWIMIYLLIAMKRIYTQSWPKTIFKYMSLGLLFLLTVILTLITNMALTALML